MRKNRTSNFIFFSIKEGEIEYAFLQEGTAWGGMWQIFNEKQASLLTSNK